MKEYIDKAVFYGKIGEREELAISRFLDTPFDSPARTRCREQMNERTAFKHMVFDEPAADVVEVVHGKWETEIDDELGILKHTCQICRFVKRTDIHVALDWNYCPNCGTKMDLKQKKA